MIHFFSGSPEAPVTTEAIDPSAPVYVDALVISSHDDDITSSAEPLMVKPSNVGVHEDGSS